MTSRLKRILVVGIAAIAVTYFAMPYLASQPGSPDDTAYQNQLAALRKKREEAKQSSASSSSIASTGTESTVNNQSRIDSDVQNPTTSAAATQVSQHLQNTLSSLQRMIPGSASKLPVANYDSNAQRLQYLQTMPVTMIESTGKQDAQIMARQDAGRANPFADLPGTQAFPKAKSKPEKVAGKKSATDLGLGPDGLPPPPPSSYAPSSLAAELAPPPPPPGIELDELPPPPEKPMLSKNLKLNAIVGDHIILAFKDRNFQKKNHFKQFITLAQGQEFDSVTLVDIGKDQATIEEHGRQITMQLDPIR